MRNQLHLEVEPENRILGFALCVFSVILLRARNLICIFLGLLWILNIIPSPVDCFICVRTFDGFSIKGYIYVKWSSSVIYGFPRKFLRMR